MHVNEGVKICFKITIYFILLVSFYILYISKALIQFNKGSTTVGFRQEQVVEPYSAPILIACPDPAFKKSFFKENGLDQLSIEKLFWRDQRYRKPFENCSSMLPVYMNMSYTLGLDWEIAMLDFTE